MSRPRKPLDPPKPTSNRPRRRLYGGGGGSGGGGGDEYDDGPAKVFARNFNKLLVAKGWKQSDLVSRVKPLLKPGQRFERGPVSNWKTGKHMPSEVNLHLIAKAFGVPVTQDMRADAPVEAQIVLRHSCCSTASRDMRNNLAPIRVAGNSPLRIMLRTVLGEHDQRAASCDVEIYSTGPYRFQSTRPNASIAIRPAKKNASADARAARVFCSRSSSA